VISGRGVSWGDHVRRDLSTGSLPPAFLTETPEVQAEVLYRIRYRGYLEREGRIVERMAGLERVRIPPDFDFLQVRGCARRAP